jgi:hypothetical protein
MKNRRLRTNNRVIVAALVTTALMTSTGFAQEKAGDDPYLLLAAARAKAEIAIRDAGPITDTSRNGFDAAGQATDQVWNKMWDMLTKARDAESRKEETARNQQFVDECNGKMETLNRDWQTFNQKDRSDLRQSLQDGINEFNTIYQAFSSQVQQEQNFKNAKLDLGQLVTVYAGMEKKIMESRAKVQAVIDKAKHLKENWDKQLAAAEAMVTKAGYPAQKPAGEKAQ